MLWFSIYIGFCALIGWFGSNRRFGFWGYFFLSFIFSPIVGLLLVIGSDKTKPPPPSQMHKVTWEMHQIAWELDALRCCVARHESVGLTPAETRKLVDRIAALQRSAMASSRRLG